MRNLILFTIGPVQSFIAQARKTQDLNAGSRLLSDLINAAITEVGMDNLIFPKAGEAMPNRFLAEIPADVTDLQAFGSNIEQTVRAAWRDIAKKAIRTLRNDANTPAGYDQQIDGFLEVFWSIESYEGDHDYKEKLLRLEKNIAAIKNIRPFTQYTWQGSMIGEKGRKCTLDGQRNVQFYRQRTGSTPRATDSPLYSTEGAVYIDKHFRNGPILQPGEGLSAVSFVKRGYRADSRFLSTAEIALADVLSELMAGEANGEIKTCIELIKQKNAQIFYDENQNSAVISALLEDPEVDPTTVKSLLACAEKVKKAARDKGLRLNKYYAVITFDGDSMGKWLAGDHLANTADLRAFQQQLASCLAAFAREAKSHLNANLGATVYAGGDDFLGFVNLSTLLPVLKWLRRAFTRMVHEPCAPLIRPGNEAKLTFSAGICVAHYKEPLSLVLQEARSAQYTAKKRHADKNAFAISVIKGSGESHTMSLPFGDDATYVERFEQVFNALIREDYSNKFIGTLRRAFERLIDIQRGHDDTYLQVGEPMRRIFQAEIKRTLKRGAANDPKVTPDDMAKYLNELLGVSPSFLNFFQMLHIADFFHRSITPAVQTTEELVN